MTEARRRTLTLVLCCVAQFMIVLDVSIVNVALPSISSDLAFTQASLSWVVNAYTLAFAGFLLLGGRAADLLGRREVFAAGLALFGAASLVGGVAQSEEALVAARGLQGLGGAIVAPASLSILTTTFREGAERNRALGLWGAMGAIGGASGALVGGVLTEALSWRWTLIINLPIGIVGALGALHVVRAGRRDEAAARDFDVIGAITGTAGLVALTYGIVGTEQHGWLSAQTLALLALGAVLLCAFIFVEARIAPRPLVPLRIFASRVLSGANVVVFFLGAATFAMWYFLTLYLQQVLGYSPIHAGVAMLPMPITIAACTQLATRFTGRLGPGPVLAGGMTLIGVGMALFARLPTDGKWAADILGPALLASAGIGLAFVPVTIAATGGVRREESGLASGLVNTSRQMGGSVGLALLAAVATQHTASVVGGVGRTEALTEGFHRAFLLGAGFGLAGALVSVLVLARVPPRPAPAARPG